MDWKIFTATFGAVLLAEMGDKTQLACMTLTAETKAPWIILGATVAALVVASVFGVLCGYALGKWLPQDLIKKAGGAMFVVIGGLMLWGKM